jgi:hypothetical protein
MEQDNTKSSGRLKSFFIFLLIFLLGVTNGAWGWLYYSHNNENARLNTNIHELTDQKTRLNEQIKALKNTDSTSKDAASGWREIPELGIKYKPTDDTKDLTFAYHGGKTPSVSFSTISISNKEPACSPDSADGLGQVGSWVKYAPTDKVDSGQTAQDQAATMQKSAEQNVRDSVKKVANFYYFYNGPQSECKTTGSDALKGIAASKKAFTTIEPSN